MEPTPLRCDFWAKLTFVSEYARKYVDSQEDMSKAPWRPMFSYPDIKRQAYDIWAIKREGDEFGFLTLNREFFDNLHVKKLKIGTEFTLGGGENRIMATGIVTLIGDKE